MTAIQPDPDFLALQTALAGQYFLERELGRGGMGVVYLAREVRLDRSVAIKVLPPALAVRPELRERFIREARTAAKLSHPNIVPIFRVDEVVGTSPQAAGRPESFVYIVMAYVEGETVGERLRARGPLPPRDVARLLREVGWALAYAHARGTVHRDVKPDNILLESGSGRALVTDFGIAQVTDAGALTVEGHVMGTAHYMSPEQAAGEPLDGRSDLYALGVVGYQALTGRLPFDAPTVPAVLAMHLTRPVPPLTLPGERAAPRALVEAIECCLAKAPGARFATGEALADALGESSQPTAELPVPLRVWLTRTDPLTPLYVAWSAFLGVTGLVGAVLGLVLDGDGVVSHVWGTLAFAALPVIPVVLFRLLQTRRVLAAGYTPDDLRLALRQHTEQQREELAFESERGPSVGGRVLRWFSYACVVALGGLTVASFLSGTPAFARAAMIAFGIGSAGAIGGAMLGMTYPGRHVRVRPAGEWQLRFYDSRLGRFALRVAGVALPRRLAPAAALHRPTELAIGLAADALFDALPASARAELREMPELLRRLEGEAQQRRAEIARLDGVLAELGGEGAAAAGAGSIGAQRLAVAAELHAARERAEERLAAAVTALESVRLDLLRLQAGPPSGEALTAILAAARRIGADVDASLAGVEQGRTRNAPSLPISPAASPPTGHGAR